jgi:hypothetical protein
MLNILEMRLKLESALTALGTSPDKCAEQLKFRGITGVPNASGFCPVANYLKKELDSQVFINGGVVAFGTNINDIDDYWLPQPVSEFIAAFDSGKYPELRMERI